MKFTNPIRYISRSISSLSPIGKAFLFLCIVFVLVYVYNSQYALVSREGFQQSKKFVSKEGDAVFDDFYVDYYDDLTHDQYKNTFELKEILRATKQDPSKLTVLDVGCGTGHHCKELAKQGAKVYGIDKSNAMITRAKSLHASHEIDFRTACALDSITFPPNSFDLIQSLYFTVYYIQNKKQFFENCFTWLKPRGYLALHLVNRNHFNPILNVADPLVIVNPQKYAKQRITQSTVKFKDFTYKADFKYEKGSDRASFNELFKDDASGNTRKNEHKFYMESQKEILRIAKSCGFIMKGYIDMVACQYDNQYIYLLYKP